jgi:enterochelin esterase family protein
MSQSRIGRISSSLTCGLLLALIAPRAQSAAQRASAMERVQDVTIPSKTYPPARHAWVFTPADYPKSCAAGCNLILAFDGAMYLGIMQLPTVLDSLTAARRTPPTVAILFDDEAARRLDDLANHQTFAKFVGDELIPWARGRFTLSNDPKNTIITGSSAGGLAAAYIAFHRPDLFGNVLSQSGAFWRGNEGSNDAPYEWVTSQYASAPKKEIRFMLDVGALETTGAMGGAAPSLVAANRKLRDALVAKQYRVD